MAEKRDFRGVSRHSGGEEADSSSCGGSTPRVGGGNSHKPKKRFIWPEELHKDFIAAVFEVGLRTADAASLESISEKCGGGEDASTTVVKATLQKMRSFR
jgi:hypothetical protein